MTVLLLNKITKIESNSQLHLLLSRLHFRCFDRTKIQNLKAILNKYLKRIYFEPSGGFIGLNNDHIADFLDKKCCLGGYEGVWPGWGRNLFGGMKMKL